jgi:hypothetical protein
VDNRRHPVICPATKSDISIDTEDPDAISVLVCHLPLGHDGDLHYDEVDDLSWKEGRP